MAFESRFICKMEGCSNLPHVYPSGMKAAYCKKHIRFRKGKFRSDIHMTGPMSIVMNLLQAALLADYPFIELPKDTDHRTIKALIDRDWMVQSKGLDGVRYKITGRGQKAFVMCAGDFNRRDGICPMCCEQPRHVRASGKLDAYCKQCLSVVARRKHERHGGRCVNPDRGCSRCGNHPLHQYSSGQYSTYCAACERVRSRLKSRKARETLMTAIRNGEPVPMCKHCHQQPRKVFANSVSSFCPECFSMLSKRRKLRRVLEKNPLRRVIVSGRTVIQ